MGGGAARSGGDAGGPISHGLPPGVRYSDLSLKQQRIYNFQEVAALLADRGFNCTRLADDRQGASFRADHKDGDYTLRVRLKTRPLIDRKYVGKGLYMAFPLDGVWHLIEHDHLVELAGKHTAWLVSPSWTGALGQYHTDSPPLALATALRPFALHSGP